MQEYKNGEFIQADFFENTGGINNTDSTFAVNPDQAVAGQNYDYVKTGAIRKRYGHEKINSSPDTQLKTLGLTLRHTLDGSKGILRAAGTKLQFVDITAESFTALTEDTLAAGSTIFDSSSTVPVKFQAFNTSTLSLDIAAGGGASKIYAAYSNTKYTALGVETPAGTISATPGGSDGLFAATGTYYYAVALRKASTQNSSNLALDVSAVVASTSQHVTIDLTSITAFDTTKYDKILLYRSVVNGATEFTTGNLIAEIDSDETSYSDLGNVFVEETIAVPRAGSAVLDNAVLPTGTYKNAVIFKRRLVTAKNNVIYYSGLNTPEAFPTSNTLTIPSGGDITSLAVVSFNTPTTTGTDEFLAVWKEKELWVITGDTYEDIAIKFVDFSGCLNSVTPIVANGFLFWIDDRGIYCWDGSGKPVYISRPIEDFFSREGSLDKSKLLYCWGSFFRKANQIIWALSDKITGEQKYEIKLDLRLSLPKVQENFGGRVADGVFTVDTTTLSLYGGCSLMPPDDREEYLIAGDEDGYLYKMYNVHNDASAGIDFQYETPFISFNVPGIAKRYHKVIAWVERVGTWSLTLEYWAGYRPGDINATSSSVAISATPDGSSALWDVAYWDTAYWDDYSVQVVPVVFNLSNAGNNGEGDSIKLRFSNSGADQPIVLHGFSVIYTPIGMRK